MDRATAILSFEGTIFDALGIRAIETSPERVVLEMEVGPRTRQPLGLLHGGASAVLAESAASIGGYLSCDASNESAVGIELNISHLRAKEGGFVRAIGAPIRKGRSLHVWAVNIEDEAGVAVAAARCTLAIRPRGRGRDE